MIDFDAALDWMDYRHVPVAQTGDMFGVQLMVRSYNGAYWSLRFPVGRCERRLEA